MIVKTPMAFPARPLTARITATSVPAPQLIRGLTLGRVVLKLLAPISDEKHAGGKAASASRYMKTPEIFELPITSSINLVASIMAPSPALPEP